MKIDAHIHIFSNSVVRDRSRFLGDAGFKLLYSSPKSRIASVRDALTYAADNGLESLWCMGFCWDSGEMCERENERLLSETRENSIFSLFSAVSAAPDSNVKKRIRKAKKDGFRGIGELSFYSCGFDASLKNYCRKVFEAACEEEMPVCFHVTEPVGHVYPGKHYTDFEVIYSLIRDFPALRVLLSHMGGGLLFYELMPEVKEAFAHVWYDTAAVPFLYDADVYEKSIGIVGAEKIIFGSDYPLLGIQRYQKDIESRISRKDASCIFGLNAERFINAKSI